MFVFSPCTPCHAHGQHEQESNMSLRRRAPQKHMRRRREQQACHALAINCTRARALTSKQQHICMHASTKTLSCSRRKERRVCTWTYAWTQGDAYTCQERFRPQHAQIPAHASHTHSLLKPADARSSDARERTRARAHSYLQPTTPAHVHHAIYDSRKLPTTFATPVDGPQ